MRDICRVLVCSFSLETSPYCQTCCGDIYRPRTIKLPPNLLRGVHQSLNKSLLHTFPILIFLLLILASSHLLSWPRVLRATFNTWIRFHCLDLTWNCLVSVIDHEEYCPLGRVRAQLDRHFMCHRPALAGGHLCETKPASWRVLKCLGLSIYNIVCNVTLVCINDRLLALAAKSTLATAHFEHSGPVSTCSGRKCQRLNYIFTVMYSPFPLRIRFHWYILYMYRVSWFCIWVQCVFSDSFSQLFSTFVYMSLATLR